MKNNILKKKNRPLSAEAFTMLNSTLIWISIMSKLDFLNDGRFWSADLVISL